MSVYGDVIIVSINYRLGIFGFLHTGDDRMANGTVTFILSLVAHRASLLVKSWFWSNLLGIFGTRDTNVIISLFDILIQHVPMSSNFHPFDRSISS